MVPVCSQPLLINTGTMIAVINENEIIRNENTDEQGGWLIDRLVIDVHMVVSQTIGTKITVGLLLHDL